MIVEKFCGIILVAFICSVIAAPSDEITTENALKMTTVDNSENEIDGKLSDDEKTTMLSDIDRKIESIEADDGKRYEEEIVLTTEEIPIKIEMNESTTSESQAISSSSMDTLSTMEQQSSTADPIRNARKQKIMNIRKSLRAHILRVFLSSLRELSKRQQMKAEESRIVAVTMRSPNAGDGVPEQNSQQEFEHSDHMQIAQQMARDLLESHLHSRNDANRNLISRMEQEESGESISPPCASCAIKGIEAMLANY